MGALYIKRSVFYSGNERDRFNEDTNNLLNKLTDTARSNIVTIEDTRLLVSAVVHYVGAWGYRRVPNTIACVTNYLQSKFQLPVTDFGNDTGVFIPSGDDAQLSSAVSKVSWLWMYPYDFIHNGKSELSKKHIKLVPFATKEARDEWIDETNNLVGRFDTHAVRVRISDLAETCQIMKQCTDYVNKWSKGRVPANIRKYYHLHQHMLGQLPYADFGPDFGISEGQQYEQTTDELAEAFESVDCYSLNSTHLISE